VGAKSAPPVPEDLKKPSLNRVKRGSQIKTAVTTTVFNFKAILEVKQVRGSRAGPSPFLTISDSRSTAAIFPCAFFGFEAWPIIKLPPCRDLQGEAVEKPLPSGYP